MLPVVIDAKQLRSLGDRVVVADVRWYLDGRSGRQAHAAGHVPGAVFIDLDVDLADPASPEGGRHPLPSATRFAEAMATLGISDADKVVAYDDAGGAVASRLVWMLRALGVEAALLDGGVAGWDGPLETGDSTRPPTAFSVRPWPRDRLATIEDAADAGRSGALLLDARGAARFAGEHEPVDPRAGHVPGAINLPFMDNTDDQGRFLAPAALRERFAAVGVASDRDVIVYCGSGVTACHHALAIEHAGLGRPRLWVGSWSQWAHDRDRPAATEPSR
jgi:thiosulfate/3-mercaptopyruvate sulfurtransferase